MQNKFKLALSERIHQRQKMREWRHKNPEKDKAIKKRWYQKKRAQGFRYRTVKGRHKWPKRKWVKVVKK